MESDVPAPRQPSSSRTPALLRRLPRLRRRPGNGSDPLGERARRAAHDTPLLTDDLALVDAELVPAFRTSDELALAAQNRWARRELGLLVLSAMLVVATSIQAAVANEAWPGVLVAALGGVSSVLSNAAKSADARGVFLRHRQEAERLRSLVWTSLSVGVTAPVLRRERALERQVAMIRLETAEGSSQGPETQSRPDPELESDGSTLLGRSSPDPRSEQLLTLYRHGRLEAQRDWYLARQQEFELAERQGTRLRTGLLVVATILGALGPAVEPEIRPWLGVAATAATAVSAVITGWMRLQAFDVRAHLYELTAARLSVADAERPVVPDPLGVQTHISRCEDVVLAEHGLWSEQTPRAAREVPIAPSPALHKPD